MFLFYLEKEMGTFSQRWKVLNCTWILSDVDSCWDILIVIIVLTLLSPIEVPITSQLLLVMEMVRFQTESLIQLIRIPHQHRLQQVTFNHDNQTDIVVANYGSSTIGVFLAYTKTTFTEMNTYSTGSAADSRGIALGDFNNDGQSRYRRCQLWNTKYRCAFQ